VTVITQIFVKHVHFEFVPSYQINDRCKTIRLIAIFISR